MYIIIMVDILQELFHNNTAYHVSNYIGPHHLADIMKRRINNEGSLHVSRYYYCKYHLSRHCEGELSSQYLDRTVIENIFKNKLQLRYLTSDGLHELDPLFVHLNKEVIEEIIYSENH